MGDWGVVVASVLAIFGMTAGYFVGYRSGTVAGELAALKSHRASSRRRERREVPDGDDE